MLIAISILIYLGIGFLVVPVVCALMDNREKYSPHEMDYGAVELSFMTVLWPLVVLLALLKLMLFYKEIRFPLFDRIYRRFRK